MTERNTSINALVAKLHELLEPFGCVGLRTDYSVSGTGANRRVIVPERHGAGNRYALLSSRDNIRPKAISAIRNFLGCEATVADEILETALALSDINDIGAWSFVSDERAARTLNGYGINGEPYKNLPGVEHAFQTLQDALPQIDRIELLVHTGQRMGGKGGKSQKGWMHFYDRAGDQVCAVSTNLLATCVRHWFGSDEDEQVVADRHLGRWANQVNADLHAFVEAAMHLLTLDSYTGVTLIDLGA